MLLKSRVLAMFPEFFVLIVRATLLLSQKILRASATISFRHFVSSFRLKNVGINFRLPKGHLAESWRVAQLL